MEGRFSFPQEIIKIVEKDSNVSVMPAPNCNSSP
jgi:hypothetical protein